MCDKKLSRQFMVTIHINTLEVFPTHEPGLFLICDLSPVLQFPGFMVPMCA